MMSKNNVWRPFTNLTNIFIALMAAFLLLFSKYEQLADIKITAFYIICGGYVAAMLLLCMESVVVGMVQTKDLARKIAPSSPVQVMMLAYLAFSLISTVLSKYPEAWLGASRSEGFVTIAIYVISFYFVAKFVQPKKWMMYLFGAAVSLMCLLSILQLAGLPLFYPAGTNYYDGYIKYNGAYIGTIGNIDFAASFFCLVIPAFALYMIKAKEKQRFVLLFPTLLSFGVLLKIWVLLGIVGIFAAAVAALPFALNLKKRGITIYFSLLPVLALAALALLYAVPFERGLFYELHSILHGSFAETFGSGRPYIWREVLIRVPDHLFFGTGPDTMLYADIAPFRRVDEVYGELVRYIDTAHNEFLNILFHQGIFAFASYVAAVISVVIRFLKNASGNAGAYIFGASIIGYLAASFFGISIFIVAPFFWLCLGFFEYFTTAKSTEVITQPSKARR